MAAKVRSSHPGMGIGLKFVDMPKTNRADLQALISRLSYSESRQNEVGVKRRPRKEVKEILDEPEVFPRVFEEWRNG